MIKFNGNAESSEIKPRYDLVPPAAVRYIAERMGLGATLRDDPKGYLQGDDAFIQDRKNHAFEHVLNYVTGTFTKEDTVLDHLKAALSNLAMLAELEEARWNQSFEAFEEPPKEEKANVLNALLNFFDKKI
jgi:hypothetical protein